MIDQQSTPQERHLFSDVQPTSHPKIKNCLWLQSASSHFPDYREPRGILRIYRFYKIEACQRKVLVGVEQQPIEGAHVP